eukprot:199012-Chlamydomonas_euryale.AAC.2
MTPYANDKTHMQASADIHPFIHPVLHRRIMDLYMIEEGRVAPRHDKAAYGLKDKAAPPSKLG